MSLVRHWLSAHCVWTHGTVSVGRNGSVNPVPITCRTLDVTKVSFHLIPTQKYTITGMIM